jgi:type IV pilus modification protein PilV
VVRLRFAGGFTLLEVLVAVFVLAIGILGAAATQLAALRTRHQSSLMSNGVRLASALADSMRANRAPMRAGDAGNPYLQLDYDAATISSAIVAPRWRRCELIRQLPASRSQCWARTRRRCRARRRRPSPCRASQA